MASTKRSLSIVLLLASALVLAACRALPFRARATPTPTPPQASAVELSWDAVEARIRPATVRVRFTLPDATPFAVTGVVYAPGLVVTVAPPLSQGPPTAVAIALPGQSDERPAELVAASPCDGVALVSVQNTSGLAAAPLGSPHVPDIGEDVLVLGYTDSATATTPVSVPAAIAGTVRDTRRELDQLAVNVNLSGLTTGSLLVDRFGAVQGLALPTGFFLPADRVRSVVETLDQRGLLWLGVGLSPHRNPERYGTSNGLVALDVSPGSPAEAAGITPGTLIERVGETELTSFAQLCSILREHRQGDELTLTVRQPQAEGIAILQTRLRVGERVTTTPTLIEQLPSPARAAQPSIYRWTFESAAESTDWPTGSSPTGSGELEEGFYRIILTQPQAFGVFLPRTVPAGTDQRISARVSLPDEAGAGLIVRYTEEPGDIRNLYLCVVVRTGGQLVATCSVALLGEVAVLLPVTPLSSLDPATDPLTLELSVQGTHLVFQVEGQTVAELDDPLLGHGQAGLWVESFDTAPVTVAFDEVTLELTPVADSAA